MANKIKVRQRKVGAHVRVDDETNRILNRLAKAGSGVTKTKLVRDAVLFRWGA